MLEIRDLLVRSNYIPTKLTKQLLFILGCHFGITLFTEIAIQFISLFGCHFRGCVCITYGNNLRVKFLFCLPL